MALARFDKQYSSAPSGKQVAPRCLCMVKTACTLGFHIKGWKELIPWREGERSGSEGNLVGAGWRANISIIMDDDAGLGSAVEANEQQQGEQGTAPSYKDHFNVTGRFDNGGVSGKCNYCRWAPDRTFPKRVIAHLGCVRGEGVEICTGAVPQAVKDAMASQCKKSGKRTVVVVTSPSSQAVRPPKRPSMGSSSSGGTGGSGGTKTWKQVTLTSKLIEMKKAEVDKHVARFCYGTGLPFHVFTSPYWIDAAAAIAAHGKESGGKYKPPSEYSLRNRLLQQEKEEVAKVMEGLRGNGRDFGITIATDAYTTKSGTQFMNFVAITVNGMEFLFAEDTTAIEKKTAEYIADLLGRAIEMVGAEKVVQTCTDNAASCLAAGRIVMRNYPHITHTPCTSHCLDLLLEDWGELDFAKELCANGALIVKLIGRYGQVRRVFTAASKQHCQGLELVKPVQTRFATQFLMLERLQKLRVAVRMTAAHPAWELAAGRSSNERAEGLQEIIAGRQFWEDVDRVLKIMAPVFSLLRLTDGEAPCMGKMYWKMWNVQQQVMKAVDDAGEEGEGIPREELSGMWLDRWNGMHSPLHGAGYCLEPEHKEDQWNRNDEVMGDFREMARKILGPENVGKAVEQLLLYRNAVLSADSIAAAKKLFGYQWWEAWGSPWPLPQIMGMKILSLCSSATSCERIWSTYGFIGSARRSRLTSERLTDLVYNFSNLKVVASASKQEGLKRLAPLWWEAEQLKAMQVDAPDGGWKNVEEEEEEADDEQSSATEDESEDERELFMW